MANKCPKCNVDNPDTVKFCGECGTQLLPAEDIRVTETMEAPKEELTRGTTLANRYEIIEELGKGGMGRVYRVEDTKLKQEVALKLIKPEIAKNKKTIERFRNELKLARNIRHKNVCGMYDLGETEGIHFITMEYIRGEDLKRFIHRSGQLAVGTAVRITKQVCEGLSEAHKLGVVHRDLKSNNIMIDKDGNVRIMDFGIARSLEAKGITGAGVMIGTPQYMSPEQVEGKEVDQRSDIYSLGIILYEMVTGRVPFEGDTPFTIGMKHKGEIPKNPKELNTQISDDLSRVILRCLEKDKEKRYQSAGEVRSELTRIEEEIPTTERFIPERKPLISREITVTFGLKKLFIPALVVVSLVIIALIIWQPWAQKEAVPIPSDKPSLAVMYFENNTGDENLDHWRKGISDLLITDLTQSKYLSVLGGDRLFNILSQLNQLEAKSYSSEILKEVASLGGVKNILRGSYSKAGDAIRIDMLLQDATTGEPIATERVEGKGEVSIFPMVDELTRRIKTSLKFSGEKISSDIDKNIGKITTNSPEALKYYIEGNKLNKKVDFPKAIEFLKKAIGVDPDFASAYSLMATVYANQNNFAERRKCLQKALELADRVSDRERYGIEADFYMSSEKTYDKAIKAYINLLELYPDMSGIRNGLGWLYYLIEDLDKAIEHCDLATQDKQQFIQPYFIQAISYGAKGLYDKATEVLNNYLSNFPDSHVIHNHLASNYTCQGKYDLALLEMDKAVALNPDYDANPLRTGIIYICQDDFINAESEFQKLLNKDEIITKSWRDLWMANLYSTQGRFKESKDLLYRGIELFKKQRDKRWESQYHLWLAYAHLKSGSPESALKECDETWKTATYVESLYLQEFCLLLRGLAYLELKSISDAQEVTDELKWILQGDINKKHIRFYYLLMGMLELKKENFSKAVQYFNDALSLIPYQKWMSPSLMQTDNQALFMDPLAFAYYKSGYLEKAIEEYERVTSLTTGRLNYGDIYAKSYYMLGKICEKQGDTAKAIEHYEKFLDLWKDADPGITEVEDARKRLAGLQK